jgi:hypothetical protein
MIDAATARQRSKTVNSEVGQKQCEEIESTILKAVDEGNFNCYIYFSPHPAVVRKFEQLGYRFNKNMGLRNGFSIKVDWKE